MIIDRSELFLGRIANTLHPLRANKKEMADRLQTWPATFRLQIFTAIHKLTTS